MRVTVKCPCGRRSSHQVVEQGAPPPPLSCDAGCEREQRKARLADAFGVGDPEAYTAVHDRNRCRYRPTAVPYSQCSCVSSLVYLVQLVTVLCHSPDLVLHPRCALKVLALLCKSS